MKWGYLPIADSGRKEGKDYENWVWRQRRSLKIFPTNDPQDIIRCYETMSRRVYTYNHNLAQATLYRYVRNPAHRNGGYQVLIQEPTPIYPDKYVSWRLGPIVRMLIRF